MTRLLVIGADAAGMSAAHQAVRTARAHDDDVGVTVLEATRVTSYSACGIPYWIAGDVGSRDDLIARSADAHRQAGIDLRLGATATALDRERRVVSYRIGEDDLEESYDRLVIATGARAIAPDWSVDPETGRPWHNAGPVKTLDDGSAWLDRLHGGGSRVVIVGAGYIGIGMAEAAKRRGRDVTLITRGRVMSTLDPELSDRIEAGLTDSGVQVVTGRSVTRVTGADGQITSLHTDDGNDHPCDLVVIALGVIPATEFAIAAGLDVGKSGALQPDPEGRIADGIWAAGDCCESRHRLTGEWTYLPLGTHANKLGRAVGSNVVRPGSLRFEGALGTAITRYVADGTHLEISRTGLSTREAQEAGIEVRSLLTDGSTASGYLAEAEPIAINVLARADDRRLLGAQIVGGAGSGKRIDAFATALWHGATIDDFAWSDLSYAPPFATAWEVTQVAARRLAERL